MPPGSQIQRLVARGFSYLWLLLFVAITAAGLARVGQGWSAAMQRERERELAFRGHAYAKAIASYLAAGGGEGARRLPQRLEDLLHDRRGAGVKQHIRQLYRDPLTGKADWQLVLAADGSGIEGVRSRASIALMSMQAGAVGQRANEVCFCLSR